MLPLARPEEIRNLVAHTFRQYGAVAHRESEMTETALIDDGRCLAWSFRLQGLMAMWLIDVGILQFYDAEGNMLETVNVFEHSEPRRMAA
jgi:hypothetical protein